MLLESLLLLLVPLVPLSAILLLLWIGPPRRESHPTFQRLK